MNNWLNQYKKVSGDSINVLDRYMDYLLEYNKKINLVSRRTTGEDLKNLIRETCLLDSLIQKPIVVDAGSGNGLLGVPIAVLNREKRVILVESKLKKQNFLADLNAHLKLNNILIQKSDVGQFLNHISVKKEKIALIARGFPNPEMLVSFLVKGKVGHLWLITSARKIIKMKKGMESITQKIYNIPFKNDIVICKMENVSRETRSKKV